MASSKDDSTAEAAEQLGSISLGEAAEWKDDDNETTATAENGTPTKMCSACGEKSDTVKKCTACKCVWYCDKECQNKHRKEHRKECKAIKKELQKRGGKLDLGTELDLGPLPDVPPREECPICMRALPICAALQVYFACCGKIVCHGCDYQHDIKAENNERANTCPFCRTVAPKSDEAVLARLNKRVECKDQKALEHLAMNYCHGLYGLSVDQGKSIELLRESADHGLPDAQYQLATFLKHGEMGLAQNEEEARKYCEEAAEGGHLVALYTLGCALEQKDGDHVAAMRHWRLSASLGLKLSMEAVIFAFEEGLLQHGHLSAIAQAFYLARAEMKSEERDKFIAYLKSTGEYKEEYDM